MKWMSICELLCLTVKLQSSKRIYYSLHVLYMEVNFLSSKEFCYCCELKREGVKIVSQTENVVKEITVHVISVLVVD